MPKFPKGVHRVVARGREYFFYQANRGTALEGARIALPRDTQAPEFWIALRKAQGLQGAATEPEIVTFGAVCDMFLAWMATTTELAESTKAQYRLGLAKARRAWNALPADGLRPVHVQALMDKMADTPGAANGVLGVLQKLSVWGRKRDHFPHSITEGITAFDPQGGHRPWTPAQMTAAEKKLTGMVRRGYFLERYTGQRGSDVVRLAPSFVDDGGFRLLQIKNGEHVGEIWVPIEPELEAEMATWEIPAGDIGPYLRQANGKKYGRKLLDKHFNEARAEIPELAGTTLHGLRATRVVELRQRGYTTLQIQDLVGMSAKMVDNYCRFADRKANGRAALVELAERRELAEHRKNKTDPKL